MGWRRLGMGVPMVATAAAVTSIIAFEVVALVGGGHGGGNGGHVGGNGRRMAAVNACITQTRFLVLVRHGSGNGVIEMIKDRDGAVVGEIASGRTPATLGGAAAADGRYVMSTATPVGRDATVIEDCWDRVFPIAPGT